jgi:3-hydroxyacyl-CoA dehydrogenase
VSGQLVRFEVEDGIGVITVDNPPVNALSPGVPEGILESVAKGNADPSVKAMVLMGAGRSFIAGADIRQFGKGAKRLGIGERPVDVLEKSAKPIVAAIHGFALGGGLETAMACNYRIAKKATKVGLPEVLIGILPGGAGTQRLPRLAGPKIALDMITSGRPVPAEEAKGYGILDQLLDDKADLRAEAIKFAKSIADKRPMPIVSKMTTKFDEYKNDPGMFDKMRKSIEKKAKGQPAPFACINAVEAAVTLPYEQGIVRERELFAPLENSDAAKGLRYAFFSERQAARLPDLPAGTKPKKIEKGAVIGAGTMGGGIAMSFVDFGLPVKILDSTQEALDRGMKRVTDNYAVAVKRGSITQQQMDERLKLIEPVLSYDVIGDADVVIEAVFEELGVKQEVFKQLDRVMKPGALILSNTSTIDVDKIGTHVKRKKDVAGAHFFSPANVMRLLEVVEGTESSPETIAATMQLGKQIGKVSAWAGNTDGFVANRSRGPFTAEASILLEDGALPEQVDKVLLEFGYPMGPFAVGDLAGLDIGWAVRKRKAAEDPNFRKNPIADKLCEMGRFGQKTGAGWYRYEKGDRTPHPDPVVAQVIKEVTSSLGIKQRSFTDDDILRRLLFASVNEACKILEEKKARRASDVDIMWLYGFGFPRYRGGLMFWADTIGSKDIYDQIVRWHNELGPRWRPSELLKQVAAKGGKLSEIVMMEA